MQIRESKNLIMDIVHGGIHLDWGERHIIDQPEFQRLRSISQNDILSLVFPGATHSRFEHSIGACHMVSLFFDSIVDKGSYQYQSIEAQVGITYLKRVIRMALLLHDVGHGPFSHQLERSPAIQKVLKADGHFEKMWASVGSWSDCYNEIPDHIEHEHYSVCIAYKLLKRCHPKCDVEPLDVLAIMETTNQKGMLSDRFIQASENAWLNIVCNSDVDEANRIPADEKAEFMRVFLRSLLSNELDADKADYMLRDAQYNSVSYGNYNNDTLIDNLACVWIPADESGLIQAGGDGIGDMKLAILRKGLSAFEDFTYSRFQLYKQIYSHKTSLMFSLILRNAIDEVMSNGDVSQDVTDALTNLDDFVFMTDHYLWEAFRRHAKKDPDSFCAKMILRNKLKFLKRLENVAKGEMPIVKSEIADEYSVSPDRIMSFATKAKFSAISSDFDKIKVICKSPNGIKIRNIFSQTDFFKRFENLTITNFYIDS